MHVTNWSATDSVCSGPLTAPQSGPESQTTVRDDAGRELAFTSEH